MKTLPLLAAFVFWLAGCTQNYEDNTWAEVKRLASPTKQFEAVLATGMGGNVSMIYVVLSGEKVEQNMYVFDADQTEGLEFAWNKENELLIKYEKARIFHFTNYWYDYENIEHIKEEIEIKIEQTSNGKALKKPTKNKK